DTNTVAGDTKSSEGADQSLTNTGTCTDKAGNLADSATFTGIYIDKTAPAVTVTGVADNATYALGAVPTAGCTTTDQPGLSGVKTNATLSLTGGTVNGVGTFIAACNGAADHAGNTASKSVTYKVEYTGVSGILQPINPDNTSVFNRGKAVPVKFRLAGDEPNGFNYSGWKLQRQQINCASFDNVDAMQEPIVENPSNAFRYDAGADQYIYNANFSDKPAGTCWKVVVTLDSNQPLESAIFKLQK
ncbi:MAG TPA: PxKF domain-containing protein, partial [Acidimicrobiales bacterium]|nr:PxKF domain-containing protein [Acidimicrobiales bacterium]